jgi:chromosomal replication initiator protein
VSDELESIWNAVHEELRQTAPDFQFHIWLEPLELAAIESKTLFVRAPDHIRSWVAERYLPLVRAAAARRFDEHATVELVGHDWSADAGADDPRRVAQAARLNPKYTFEQFVIGDGNRFAHAAALAAAELPGQAYNPLFLYGAPGLGKTHLLHAIGDYVERYGGGLTVCYATVEEFTSAFVGALQEGRTGEFKSRFRGADIVLIDDVQFLASKQRTREEFFHTFNALYESGRQLVITSDCGPDELPGLEERLIERFRSGLVVELEPPDFQVRRAILEKRARLDGVMTTDVVLDEIASRVTSSVRALEGALIRVVAYASLRDRDLTPALVHHVLSRLGKGAPALVCSVRDIIDAAAEEFGVRQDELLARDRRPSVASARQVAMYLARELTQQSLPEIGRQMGNRNHSTVLHAVNRVRDSLTTDPAVRSAVDKLRSRLGAPA